MSSSRNNLHQLSWIAHGRWPHLSVFRIELWSHASSHYPHAAELGAFLSSHPWIIDLGIYPHAGSSPPLVLAPTAMPYLTTFTGLCGQVSDLPNVYWLQSLPLLRQTPLPSSLVTGALQRLTSLTSLEICLEDAGDISLFCDVLSACPGLVTFNVSFWTTCNMKQLKVISLHLQRLARLRTLTLLKTYRLTDGTMLNAALLLLARNPRLHEIHLVWMTHTAWKQSGNYTICAEAQYMDAHEFGPRPLGGSFTRRFRYALDDRRPLLGSVSKGLAKMRR
ncbi:hypothetical protein C8R44DRAFT_866051 [Mycena epipterygia]|nr:hypothetical protein C8R44DRAFT_866051 [Mycena epipterygia]